MIEQDTLSLLTEEMIPRSHRKGLLNFAMSSVRRRLSLLKSQERFLRQESDMVSNPKIHADQLSPGGGAELAAEVGAFSADHLEYVSQEGIRRMAEKGVTAVLLPGASFFLSMKKYPPVREMIEKGVAVSLATDLNPGSSMTESLPLMMTMGCTMFKMIPREVIQATTIHAARSMGREKEIGSLEVGKQADLLLLDIPNYRYLPYHFGVDHAEYVIKNGKSSLSETHVNEDCGMRIADYPLLTVH